MGKDGTLTGEGAKAASVTVYGPRGADEKGNKIPKTHVVNCGLPVDCLNGVNTSYPHYNACSPTQKDYIYVHRTNTTVMRDLILLVVRLYLMAVCSLIMMIG